MRFDIRAALSSDHDSIGAVERAAFGRDGEARLVQRLRSDGEAIVELVATTAENVVGHILFTRLPIDGPRGIVKAVALAPLAVHPDHQKHGVGAALVQRGLGACRSAGAVAVVVLGDSTYYSRFGFSAALAENLRSPYVGPAFMALELKDRALAGGGTVRYPAAFEGID